MKKIIPISSRKKLYTWSDPPAMVVADYHATFTAIKTAIETSTGSSMTTAQKNAGDRFVRELNGELNMANGYATVDLWTTKLAGKALYSLVGGSMAANKFNWLDLRDLDAAFRLTSVGSPVHGSTGVEFNGTTQYLNTNLTPSGVLTVNNTSISLYSKTNSATGVIDMGSEDTGTIPRILMALRWTDDNTYLDQYAPAGAGRIVGSGQSSDGLFTASRTANNVFKGYKGATEIASGTSAQSDSLPVWPIFIGALNSGGSAAGYSARTFALAKISAGLTAAENTAWSNAATAYITSL